MNSIQSKVAELIKRSSPNVNIPSEESQIQAFLDLKIENLDMDSLDSMELIMEIEDHFDIILDEEMVLDCKQVGALINLVTTSLNAKH